MKSGYPWHALGQKLKMIDQEMKIVTDEYGHIHDSMTRINTELDTLARQHQQAANSLPQTIRSILQDETSALQNRWLVSIASMIIVGVGIALTFASNEPALKFIKENGGWVGLILAICGFVGVMLVSRRNKKNLKS